MNLIDPPNPTGVLAAQGNLIQSPFLYLQAVGSDGSDGTVPGAHLRWKLTRQVGEQHLPKGDLAGPGGPFETNIGFSRAKDFVHVFRAPYLKPVEIIIDPLTTPFDAVRELGGRREWHYRVQAAGQLPQRHVVIRFMDVALYDKAKAEVGDFDVRAARARFLLLYTGVIEVQPVGELSFSVRSGVRGPVDAKQPKYCVQMETVSTPDQLPDATRGISARKQCCDRSAGGQLPSFDPGATLSGILQTGTKRAIGPADPRLEGDVIERIEAIKHKKTKRNEKLARLERLRPSLDDALIERKPTGEGTKPSDSKQQASAGCRIVCENIEYVRLRCTNGVFGPITFELYEDFILFTRDWQRLGQFALELDDAVVKDRLISPDPGLVGSWPKFNDGAKIELDNYLDRWTRPIGLRGAVKTYLDASRSDVLARKLLPSQYPGDSSAMEVSYLQMLNLVSIDYHAARMLGLGCFDAQKEPDDPRRWVYLAVYDTYRKIGGAEKEVGEEFFRRHLHMSLPTSIHDHRLPLEPRLTAIHYGVTANEVTANPAMLTDAQGYSSYDDVRFINLDKAPYPYPRPLQPFWAETAQFNMSDHTAPISIGVEYRKQGEPSWRRPELSHDEDYNDPTGVPEAVPTPEQDNPIFRHLEREEGIHEYALYGVNWFSRPSPLSNIRATDKTSFPKRNTLLPPFNVGAHYVQKESPLLFTSQDEQDALAAREAANPGADNARTRLTFDWNHVNCSAYADADFVEVFFREQAPATCAGKIKSHTAPSSGPTFVVRTEALLLESQSPATSLVPTIPVGQEGRYLGAVFACASGQFIVVGVAQSSVVGEGPIFTLERVNEQVATEVDDDGDGVGDGVFVTENRWRPETANEYAGASFMVMENLADTSQWSKLSKTLALVLHSNHTETVNYADGTSESFRYGGVFAPATVTDLGEGIYRAVFTTFVLAAHPDPDVEWYKGSARMVTAAGPLEVVEVWRVETDGVAPLEIYVYKPDFATAPLATGVRSVNFHPGYRLYLAPEPTASFDASTMLPAAGQAMKTTFLCVRAVDQLGASSFVRSALTVPLPVMAREITEPKPVGQPAGPTYATRPDYYGKATYTFDAAVDTSGGRQPHSMMFFRANDRSLLDALYTTATANTVKVELEARRDDGFFSQRWIDVVGFNYDTDGRFLDHDGYRLPDPDNTATNALFTGTTHPGSGAAMRAAVRAAIERSFVPLTERPVIYAYIQAGKQTSRARAVVRDPQSGAVLGPGDAGWDPNPMVRRFVTGGTTKVRFTDFSLDGASRNAYFYYAIELNVSGVRSAPSPICGPIQLVNAAPAEAPEILRVTSRPGHARMGVVPAVLLEINDYPETAGISHVELYRTTEPGRSHSVRSMDLALRVAIGEPLIDTFEDLTFPPFGASLFYRAVALRTIKNEAGVDEQIPSKPSNRVLASVIDTENPPAPVLSYTQGAVLSGPSALQNVSLSWDRTTYRGTYHVYKMTAKGTWRKLYTTSEPLDNFVFPPGGDFATYPETSLLAKEDDDGNELFHRFRVQVVNASGLVNVTERELTI